MLVARQGDGGLRRGGSVRSPVAQRLKHRTAQTHERVEATLGLLDSRLSAEPDTSEVLGWLYVSEGSTLGGAVIDRTLRALPEGAQLRLRTFTPYLEGPGPMWRDYLEFLSAWVGDDASRADQVVAAAEHTFDSLERWLTPLSSEDAA
jgi:heme oxygenase